MKWRAAQVREHWRRHEDMMIAATAIEHHIIAAARNERPFQRRGQFRIIPNLAGSN